MPLGTVKLFHDAVYYSLEWSPAVFLAKMVLSGNFRKLGELGKARILPNSPFSIPYFSTTPYRFGNHRVCKYVLRPTSTFKSPSPTKDKNYLTLAAQTHLSQEPATFNFAVQFGKEGQTVEDAAEDWTREPEVVLATLVIPRQTVSDQGQNDLKFSPSNALPEHFPVGPLNQARALIYNALSEYRTKRNEAPSSKL